MRDRWMDIGIEYLEGEIIFDSKILNKKIEIYDSSYRWTDKLGHL